MDAKQKTDEPRMNTDVRGWGRTVEGSRFLKVAGNLS